MRKISLDSGVQNQPQNIVKNHGSYMTVSNTTVINFSKLAQAIGMSEVELLKKYDLDNNGIISSYGTNGDEIANAEQELNIKLNKYKTNATNLKICKGYLFASDDNDKVIYSVEKDPVLMPQSNQKRPITKVIRYIEDFRKEYAWHFNDKENLDLKLSENMENKILVKEYPMGAEPRREFFSNIDIKVMKREEYRNSKGEYVIKQEVNVGDLSLSRFRFYKDDPYLDKGEDKTDCKEVFFQNGKEVTFEHEKDGYKITSKDGNVKYYSSDGKSISWLLYKWNNF